MRKLALLITLAITVSGLTGCGMRAPESPAAGDTSSGDSGSADPIVIHTEAPEAKAQTEAQTETAAQEETAGASQAETAAAQTEAQETKKLNFTLARQLDTKPRETFENVLLKSMGVKQ